MVVLVLPMVIVVGGFAYRHFARRRARRRVIKSAALDRAIASPVDATGHEDDLENVSDVMIIASEAPPPYPAETPTPRSAEPSEDSLDPTIPEPEDLETYVRDKPPRYSSVVLQVQNA
ncbi:hypothetical protein BJV74DRAFT_800137 [Russula compacta]|nr:hypothetical protein BJV74DRAFT_800137 [Russula compacta]